MLATGVEVVGSGVFVLWGGSIMKNATHTDSHNIFLVKLFVFSVVMSYFKVVKDLISPGLGY